MKRILSLLTAIFMSVLALNAQTFTFDMRDYDNASIKFKATVDVAAKRLKLTKAGQTLFSIPYYAHNIYKPKNRIGFALSSSSIADVTTEASSYFIIIRDNGNIIVKLSNGTEYLMTSNNPDSHAPTYDRLARALDNDNASNPPSNPSTNGSNKTFTANGVSFTMVYVEGGTFTMGATSEQGSDASSDEKPTHRVTLSSYMIGQTEVTQDLWQAVMGNNPSRFTGGASRPVERVSWDDCQTFLRKLNSLTGQRFRLPTEAEWEFAARGGNKTKHYKYSGSNTLDNVAWYDENSGSTTHPVGTKSANELGIYDMSGNVWEWCSDWYGSYSSSSQTNPQGPSSGSYRVIRGGSWFNYAWYCRVSYRSCRTPDGCDISLCLRLAL